MARYSIPRFRPQIVGLATIIVMASSLSVTGAVQAPSAAPKTVPTVSPAALEALLPALDGWTKDRVTSNQITASESCTYALADAVYRNGDAKIRVGLADTGFDADALAALATAVVIFPAGHTDVIPPDTAVTRSTYNGSPSATLWTSTKREGEFTVVVGGRFVVKIEGTNIDSLEVLRTTVGRIDLKKLEALGSH